MKILDVTVLMYLNDEGSEFHVPVRDFVERAYADSDVLGLPWHSIVGFLRLTTRRIGGRTLLSRDQAEHFVSTLLSRPNVLVVEPGPRHWRILTELSAAAGARGKLYPDAHLAALAIENGAELCSADSNFARFPRLKWTDPTRPPA
ncbi:MAG: PIN domain-containing protein [Gemmatimonadaceae bacterium]|nr:PIN domain-containing protein [Gemmatimonadaceae bacterium]MCW5827104.1 PIN domain-containing protein [Gemmatimonadaceae bacterium]